MEANSPDSERLFCKETMSLEDDELNIALELEQNYYAERAKLHEKSPSPKRMRIGIKRGEKTIGYMGKLTYCGEELVFEDDIEEKVEKDAGNFPVDVVNEYQNLNSKVDVLRESNGAKISEHTYVSDDELPVFVTQMKELEDKYPGIQAQVKPQ